MSVQGADLSIFYHNNWEPDAYLCARAPLFRADYHCPYPGLALQVLGLLAARLHPQTLIYNTPVNRTLSSLPTGHNLQAATAARSSAAQSISELNILNLPDEPEEQLVNSSYIQLIFNYLEQYPTAACIFPHFVSTSSRNIRFQATEAVFFRTSYTVSSTAFSAGYFELAKVFSWQLWLPLLGLFVVLKCITLVSDRHRVDIDVKSRLSWLSLFVALFISLYRGGLLSNLLIERERPMFVSINDLANKIRTKQIVLMAPKDHYALDLIQEYRRFNVLKEALKVSPPILTSSSTVSYMQLNATGDSTLLLVNTATNSLYHVIRYQKLRSKLFPSLGTVPISLYCNRLVTDWTMTELNQTIHDLQPQFNKLQERYVQNLDFEYHRHRHKTYVRLLESLSLDDFKGSILLLVCGMLFSFSYWASEKLASYIWHILPL